MLYSSSCVFLAMETTSRTFDTAATDENDNLNLGDAKVEHLAMVCAPGHFADSDSDNDSICSTVLDDLPEQWSLEKQFEEAQKLAILLARNRYMEAYGQLKEYCDVSLMHAYGHAWLMSIRAVMYFKKKRDVFKDALDACSKAMTMLDLRRKQRGWSSYVKNQNYNQMTDEQCHAELVHAEAQVLYGILFALNEQSFIGFVRAALKVRYNF